MPTIKWNNIFAELLGTFSLTLVVLLSINNKAFPVPTPFLAALTLGGFVFTIGRISGAHINPAITVALASIKKIDRNHAILYIAAQCIGAGVAHFISTIFITAPTALIALSTPQVALAEVLGAFCLAFAVQSVVTEEVPANASGLVIGGGLLVGLSLASIASNAVLNPAVALGINSLSPAYILGPIVGALLGTHVYRALLGKKPAPAKQ